MANSLSKLVLASCLSAGVLAASPAAADVFSSQGFSGETSTLNALPGVNLDVTPGSSVSSNCTEVEKPAYAYGRDRTGSGTWTECKVGNFTFSSGSNSSQIMGRDPAYNFQPPPWAEGWRP